MRYVNLSPIYLTKRYSEVNILNSIHVMNILYTCMVGNIEKNQQ